MQVIFVAAAGASAALAGLVFVAVSINIERILALEARPIGRSSCTGIPTTCSGVG